MSRNMCDTVDFPMPIDPVSPSATSALGRVEHAMRARCAMRRDVRVRACVRDACVPSKVERDDMCGSERLIQFFLTFFFIFVCSFQS
jgi:hypothetical protein